MKRTPLARSSKPMRRTRLRPRSKARVVQAEQFVPVIRQALVRDGGCQFVRWVGDADTALPLAALECWGPLHPHHILPRSRGGADVLDNLVTLCAAHHQYVHEHPTIAAGLGLLASTTYQGNNE